MIQAGDVVESGGDLRAKRIGGADAVGIVGRNVRVAEQRGEEGHEHAGDRCLGDEDLLHVALAVGGAQLAQVAGIRAHDRDLARREPGTGDQSVEPVDVGATTPHQQERLLQALRQGRSRRDVAGRKQHVERQNPGRIAHRSGDLVRPLLLHLQAEGAQDRDHLRQRQSRPVEQDLQRQVARTGITGAVELQGDLPGCERVDRQRILHTAGWREVLLVGGGERVVELAQQRADRRVADTSPQLRGEIVLPAAGRVGDATLEVVGIE